MDSMVFDDNSVLGRIAALRTREEQPG